MGELQNGLPKKKKSSYSRVIPYNKKRKLYSMFYYNNNKEKEIVESETHTYSCLPIPNTCSHDTPSRTQIDEYH